MARFRDLQNMYPDCTRHGGLQGPTSLRKMRP